jgi:hypothetical protein
VPSSTAPGPDARNAFLAADIEQRLREAAVLDRWAADEDFWVRRAALLSLLRPPQGARIGPTLALGPTYVCSRCGNGDTRVSWLWQRRQSDLAEVARPPRLRAR